MIINSILPYVGLCTAFAIPWVKRFILDKKCKKDQYATKKSSMAAFKTLYSGADYVIHFKYSGILNIVYITMMYGVGMPILFPIAAFNFINQYVCERIIVSYCMKQPPALDDKLTNNTLGMLKFAPLLMLMNGYWMISNKQIFENVTAYIQISSQKMPSKHYLDFTVNWASPIFLMAIAAIFLIVIQNVFSDYLQRWGFTLQAKEIKVDEDLPKFLTTVKLSQADEILSEEFNMRENFGFSFNDGDTIAALRESKNPKKAIVGSPWYQILSNPKYSNLFNYIGSFTSERYKIIEDGSHDHVENDKTIYPLQVQRTRAEQSDLVMILLNLAYIPDAVIKQLTDFKPEWSIKFKELMQKHYSDAKF